jgi:formamidopyrimidine-DNA glycosylase
LAVEEFAEVPELPEVEVVRRGLDRWVTGRVIADAAVLHARAVRRHEGSLRDDLMGERIRCVSRRGKYLWMPLSGSDAALVAHLGMSGQLLMQSPSTPDEAHLRARFTFTDQGPELRFVDQRTFGGLMVTPLAPDGAGGQVPDVISHIARDPLDPAFDEESFESRLRARDTEIKRALLDQSLVSGIGNIYADESLWRAGLHGRRRTGSLVGSSVRDLLIHVRAVMTEALAQGGTSFDSLYVNVNGESGYFDRSLDAYGQEGEPCTRCGTLIERERFMNRSSAFCPRCQPIS